MHSVTELEYLRDSLTQVPPLRPDARRANQIRPLDYDTGYLPSTNGSAIVSAADGSQCIIGVKTKVVASHDDLLQVSVEINGKKDNDKLIQSLIPTLHHTLSNCPQLLERLKLNNKYAYKLYVDCVVLSYTAHPLGILSLGIFHALKTTYLAKMIPAETEDNLDEIPQFFDSWDEAIPLCKGWNPPVLVIAALIGDNIVLDPTQPEQEVAEAVLCMAWKDGKLSSPIRTMDTVSTPYIGGFSTKKLLSAVSMIQDAAQELIKEEPNQ